MNSCISSRTVPMRTGTSDRAAASSTSPTVGGSTTPSATGLKAVNQAMGSTSIACCAARRSSSGATRRRSIASAGSAASAPTPLEQVGRGAGGPGRRSQLAERRALDDGLVEQGGGVGRGQEGDDAGAAGRLPEDRDVARVATEPGGVGLHPPQGGHLVEEAEVAGGRATSVLGQVGEAERAEPVVEGDDDDVAVGRHRRPVVPGGRSGARDEGAAVEPHEHRAVAVVAGGRPHVQRQAVLADRLVAGAEVLVEGAADLGRDRAGGRRRANPGPRCRLDRRFEPERTDWRSGERDASERAHRSHLLAGNPPRARLDDHCAVHPCDTSPVMPRYPRRRRYRRPAPHRHAAARNGAGGRQLRSGAVPYEREQLPPTPWGHVRGTFQRATGEVVRWGWDAAVRPRRDRSPHPHRPPVRPVRRGVA